MRAGVLQGMNHGMRRTMWCAGTVIGGLAAVLLALPLPAGASVSGAGRPEVRTVKRISLSVSSDVVKPGSPVVITASVAPREPGRTVMLRVKFHSRFRNLASATTGASGVVRFVRTFTGLGAVRLRAEVLATGVEPAVMGSVVRTQVVTVLPFVLPAGTQLQPGDSGPLVTDLQRRLSQLGYWLGAPGGYFGDATEQAVYALEKAAGITRSGTVNAQFAAALNAETVPVPRTTTGNAIDVDLEHDLLEIVQNGQLAYTLNTSTGGGYSYVQDGVTNVAITPRGTFATARIVNGTVVDTLGTLWRPRFFDAGYAIHGDTWVPPYAASHGCVRVSNEAIDWIWANNLDPIGETISVY
jgi:peptidoglycan hydrolase-like protein with peptidoglycan-binding domain